MSKSKLINRVVTAIILIIATLIGAYVESQTAKNDVVTPPASGNLIDSVQISDQIGTAYEGLMALEVKGRAAKTGYARKLFGNGWADDGTCDTRNKILARDLVDITYKINSCTVLSGTLQDPYTGKLLPFIRGEDTSDDIQIDHIVALSDAWQKGAQQLTNDLRIQLANDGLNLLAVDGLSNQQKADSDAASWLPPNTSFRCNFVARQVSVKLKYSLWITAAEKDSISNVLRSCPSEPLTQ